MTDNTTETPLDPQDLADIEELGDAPTQRCILELWGHILADAVTNGERPIDIHTAHRTVATWPILSIPDTAEYHRVYHHILDGFGEILSDVLADDDVAFEFTGDEDAEHNHRHYRDVLVLWFLRLDDYEQAWTPLDENAAVWVAALADARAFVFSPVGLAGHLDVIGFRMSDDEFLGAVASFREARGE